MGYSVKHDGKTYDVATQDQMLDLMRVLSHELHPAGTRAKIAALKAENAQLRQHKQADYNEAQATIGKLIALLAAGPGEDSDEYQQALALVGMVPAGDVSGDDADERRGVGGWY
jgi:hypothetical protein